MRDTCTDCQKIKTIVLRFSAEGNGVTVALKLCRDCLKKRFEAKK